MHTVARRHPRHDYFELLFASAIVNVVRAIFESKIDTATSRSNSMDEGNRMKRDKPFCLNVYIAGYRRIQKNTQVF